ncbi:MAG: hypothetical protein EOO06_14345 [Chitinophagaceae bacterium]|nr:MAG: hypothetical protein EOO06_14345 [Chitinophagaceae bacterium]
MSKKKSAYQTTDGQSYLTKRIVVSKARAAGLDATKKAMATMGYIVVAEGNEIVKKYENGIREVISQIEPA